MGSPQTPLGPPSRSGFALQTEALRPAVRAVVAAVLRQGHMHPDVEDCTHEALRRALEGQDRLRPGEPLRPWLLGIARHVALDSLRAKARDQRRHLRTQDESGDSPIDRVPDSTPGADERLDRARRAAAVQAAMRELPEDHRRALTLFHVDGLPYREISDRLGVPIGTVCTWISRGRRSIAARLGETGESQ